MKRISKPTFDEEQLLWDRGIQYVAGIDEVGRGAFAGPVVAAAVIFEKVGPLSRSDLKELSGINDSKLLTPQKRVVLAEVIKQKAVSYAIAEVSVSYINKNGIGKASLLAFANALHSIMKNVSGIKEKKYSTPYMLQTTNSYVLTDAFLVPGIDACYQKNIIRGDQKSVSIAAASIIAKVYRDKLMAGLDQKYSHYEFAVHKGYGTKKHREWIKQYGLCDLHRTSFDLVKFL